MDNSPTAVPGHHRILHLTDTHLLGDPQQRHHGVDTAANLRAVLKRASDLEHLDLVAITGDLSEDGSETSYRRLRSIVEPWAKARGAQVVYLMGNHDHRPSFGAVLRNGIIAHNQLLSSEDAESFTGQKSDDDAAHAAQYQVDRAAGLTHRPLFAVTDLHGLQVITLDTSVPLRGYGDLLPAQLEELAHALDTPAAAGSLLLMHHPPVPAQTDLLHALSLQDPQSLASVLAASDVRLILSGHYHHSLQQLWQVTNSRNIPVVVTAAVTNLAEPLGDPAEEISTMGAGGSIVDLFADGAVRVLPFHVPFTTSGNVAMHLDKATVEQVIKAAGPQASPSS